MSAQPAVVLNPVHVSCYITAANRATPVFEVVPDRHCVRVVTKPLGDHAPASAATLSSSPNASASISSSTNAVPNAEWTFDALFAAVPTSSSPSLASDFYRDVTHPAFHQVIDGWNTNIVAWGIHPTQKYRLLFGKSTGVASTSTSSASASQQQQLHTGDNDIDVLELYGQLGGLLHEFFAPSRNVTAQVQQQHASTVERGWRVGISSWIIVNNQVIDLLKPALTSPQPATTRADTVAASASPSSSSSDAQAPSLSFVSLEATSFASACRVLQIAKTNRIVMKQHAEHAHFFVRLAFFFDGQVSTLHVVDLVDLKDVRDAVALHEKQELFDILHELRYPPASPRHSMASPLKSVSGGSNSDPSKLGATSLPSFLTRKPATPNPSLTMALSNFMLPLLTANAKTFLYANVIDSRASLRESVQLLNAVANVKGYACACKRLRNIEFHQLGFQRLPDELNRAPQDDADATAAVVAVGESLLSRLAAPSPTRSMSLDALAAARVAHHPVGAHFSTGDLSSVSLSGSTHSLSHSAVQPPPQQQPTLASPLHSSHRRDSFSSVPMESETLAWLESFSQRKREILGARIDTVVPLVAHHQLDSASSMSSVTAAKPKVTLRYSDERRLSSNSTRDAIDTTHTLSYTDDTVRFDASRYDEPTASRSPSTARTSTAQTSADLLARLRDAMGSHERSALRRSNSEPLPITDDDNNESPQALGDTRSPLQPTDKPVRPPEAPRDMYKRSSDHQSQRNDDRSLLAALERANVPAKALAPADVDGLDATTVNRIQATEAALLRKNYDALLTIVQEQQQLRVAAEARAAEATHDRDEVRASLEVQVEHMKLVNVTLRCKVRALETTSALPHVFEQYERELEALSHEVQQLRDRNVALELKMVESDGGGGTGVGSVHDLKKKYQAIVDDKQQLEKQLFELRKKERHFMVHSKLVGDSTRRVDQLSRALTSKDEALVVTQLKKLRMSAERNQAHEAADELHRANEQLLIEKAAATEELLATKMYLASLENEQRKADILDKFVQKHGDRMNRVRAAAGSMSASNSDASSSWRRDAAARACEDKVLKTVKRSLPQLVPLVNKLLRRLEMQELALCEFAEREVDFINLLVELVSDQPAMSLKTMIEHEMTRLPV